MGAKLKSKTHLLDMFFDFLKPFFARLASKFSKSADMTQKKIFLIKKEFHADLNLLKKLLKLHQKQIFTNMSKSEKVHISRFCK